MKYAHFFLSRFKALTQRERLLLVGAVLVAVWLLFDFALLRPQQAQARLLRDKLVQQHAEVEALNVAVQALSKAQKVDPLAKQRAERDELRNTFAQAQTLIAHATANVRMSEVIRTMVATRPGLTLVSLKTLPPETFFKGSVAPGPKAAAADAGPTPALYKHGVEIVVKGTYVSLVPYLRELERNADGIFWSQVKLDVGAYPEATLRMTIHTLSARPELPLG
jgi:MSHA biogenesis protein MshJ